MTLSLSFEDNFFDVRKKIVFFNARVIMKSYENSLNFPEEFEL